MKPMKIRNNNLNLKLKKHMNFKKNASKYKKNM